MDPQGLACVKHLLAASLCSQLSVLPHSVLPRIGIIAKLTPQVGRAAEARSRSWAPRACQQWNQKLEPAYRLPSCSSFLWPPQAQRLLRGGL